MMPLTPFALATHLPASTFIPPLLFSNALAPTVCEVYLLQQPSCIQWPSLSRCNHRHSHPFFAELGDTGDHC